MTVFDLMETKNLSFTKTDRTIYENLRRHPEQFAQASYEELVRVMGVSQSALTRFAKKLGFSGYADLQFQLRNDLKTQSGKGEVETNAQIYSDYLLCVENEVDKQAIAKLAHGILLASKVTCLGFQYSGLPARFLSFNLLSEYGVNAEKPEFDYLIHSYTDDELIIIFSAADGNFFRPLLNRVSTLDEARRPHVVLVTMSPKHTLRHRCDEVILLPSPGKVIALHLATLENMMFMMFADMVLSEVDRQQGEG